MKLVILGGTAAQKVSTLLKSAADNLDISVYKDLITFIEQSSVRPPQIDRMLVMQDAYTKCDGDKEAAMTQFSHYICNQFPELRVISIGADPEFLEMSCKVLASPLYVTLRSTKGSAAVFNDIAMLPIDRLRTVYAQNVVVSDDDSAMSVETSTPQSVVSTAPVEKKRSKGLFGRRKDKPSKAGTSPAQSLTAGQGSGFGATQGSTNPFETPFGGNTAFGAAQGGTNPFDTQASGTSAFGGEQSSNPFNTENTASNPFSAGNRQSAEENPSEGIMKNPFEQGGTSGGEGNPFGQSFGSPEAQTNSFEEQVNPFSVASNNPAVGAFDDTTANSGNPFADGFNSGSETAENSVQGGFDFGGADNFGFSQSSSQGIEEAQNPFNTTQSSGLGAPVRRAENVVETGQDDIEEADFVPSNPFATPSGFSDTSRINSGSEVLLDTENNSEIEEADESMGFINSPYMQTPAPEHSVDMSKLTARSVGNQYNFKDAVATAEPRTPRRVANVEEATTAQQSQMGIIDDTSYQMQAAPTRVVERIVEKEVYIDAGGEIPAQKLLEAGKQVTIIVTGDRRSGVTYTCLTLAALYAKRVSTLVVDLDTETCGGQLYQDIESLMGEEENVQHGVLRARNATLLSNLVHHDSTDGYDYLFSMIGNEPATANDIKAVQSSLMAQRAYQLVIVDCPWSKISLLDELITKAKILVCVDPDITGCHNTVELLNDLQVQDRLVTALERSGAYIAKQGGSVDNLTQNMRWISEAFEAKNIDWASLRILGSSSREGLIECMKKL